MKRVVLPAEHKGRCLAEYDGLNTDFIDFFSMQWKWRATDSISMIWTFICRVITVCERAATALKACFNSDTTLLLKHCSHVLFCVSVQSSEVICLIISFPFLSWSENTSYEAQIFSVYLLLWDQVWLLWLISLSIIIQDRDLFLCMRHMASICYKSTSKYEISVVKIFYSQYCDANPSLTSTRSHLQKSWTKQNIKASQDIFV